MEKYTKAIVWPANPDPDTEDMDPAEGNVEENIDFFGGSFERTP